MAQSMPTNPPLDVENHAQLLDYLRERNCLESGAHVECHTLAGGVSSRTVLVRPVRGRVAGWVIKQSLAKLRTPVDWFCDPARIQREAQALRTLNRLLPSEAVPDFEFYDDQHKLLAMSAVPQPHRNWRDELLAGHIDTRLVQQFGELLATLHHSALGQAERLSEEFADTQYFEHLRVEPYYEFTAHELPAAAPFLNQLVGSTRTRKRTLVHGDYSPKNILHHRGRLVLVDHEVAHWGDPAFDVGFALTHLLSKANHLPDCREQFGHAAREFWTSYAQAIPANPLLSGLDTAVVRHTLGCLLARVAGRSQLAYLTPDASVRQQKIVCELMGEVPHSTERMISEFTNRL